MRLREFTNDTVANWRTIAARNNLANPDLIMPGQVLDIGDGVVMPKGTTYTVKPGDTLSGIAKNIQRGQIPDSGSSTSVEPKPPVTSSNPSTLPKIALPNVDPPEVKRGRPTMPADRDQTPPAANKAKPTQPDYHDPSYDAPPAAKSAPPVRSGPLATGQDLEASKENLKKYDADQKQRMADREKELAAAEKERKDIEKWRKKQTDPRVDPKGVPKKWNSIPSQQTDKDTAPTNDKLKTIQKNVHGQESGSGKTDTSKPNYAGAIGPMQILPKTFDWLKQIGKIPQYYDIKNPEHNKAGGDALLGHYHDKYKGDPAKVYAAYYGGPSAVNKDGSINTHWRDKKNPKAPTVGEYIRQAMSRSGK
jgi:LysM repeat protein